MTTEEILRMAREAGYDPDDGGVFKFDQFDVERFAALVYAEAHKDGLDDFEAVVLPAAIKAEREACAKVCLDVLKKWQESGDSSEYTRPDALDCAAAIRARGQA